MSDTNLASDAPADPVLNAGDTPAADPPPQPEPQPDPPAPRMIPVETFTREVTPLRAKVRDLELRGEEDRRRLQEAQELIARFQHGNGTEAPPPAPAPRAREFTDADVDRRAMELNFQRDASAVSESGVKAYGQRWGDSINILGSFNLNTPDFISSIMDVAGRDKTHELVNEIAQNPETAAALAGMSPARRIAEITRMSERLIAKPSTPPAPSPVPAKNVSKAPPPAPRVEPNAGKVVDWRSDDASDEEFSRGWNETMLKRTARR